MLVKLTPSVNVINILHSPFFIQKSIWQLFSSYLLQEKGARSTLYKKFAHKMLMQLTSAKCFGDFVRIVICVSRSFWWTYIRYNNRSISSLKMQVIMENNLRSVWIFISLLSVSFWLCPKLYSLEQCFSTWVTRNPEDPCIFYWVLRESSN